VVGGVVIRKWLEREGGGLRMRRGRGKTLRLTFVRFNPHCLNSDVGSKALLYAR